MKRIIAFCLLLAVTTPVHALSFSVTYDGSTASADLFGTEPRCSIVPCSMPLGSSLAGGFDLYVHAAGTGAWQVTAPLGDLLFWAGFDTNAPGGSSDTTASFLRGGTQVASFSGSDGSPFSGALYKGANILPAGTLPVGLTFDAVLVTILTAGNGVVRASADVLGGMPFFREAGIAFLTDAPLPVAQTPLPPAILLFASALIGLGWLGRHVKASRAA